MQGAIDEGCACACLEITSQTLRLEPWSRAHPQQDTPHPRRIPQITTPLVKPP
jgi:hypothetical protein